LVSTRGIMTVADRFQRLPTAAKLLLILTAVLLPIGIALAWIGNSGIRQANLALEGRNRDQSRAASQEIESLIARNALALRVAAAGALRDPKGDVCAEAASALATAPAITREFALRNADGKLLCTYGGFTPLAENSLIAPGDIRVWLDPSSRQIDIRVGVVGGMVTASLPITELRNAVTDITLPIQLLEVRDSESALTMIGSESRAHELSVNDWPIGNSGLVIRVGLPHQQITTFDRLLLLLPLLMWIAAAIIAWSLVSRLLVRPLKQLENAVLAYRPGEGDHELPRKLGPSEEIQELRNAFSRTIGRVEESERETNSALEGQRRLVREVHHRVKNNLQVVASLLNIHGRSAGTPDARAAYAGISRRVGALSVVHRNHFAEMEESRGISLRPLVTELAAELRASAPDAARGLTIDLEIDTVFTTQDVAVAVSFLITEIIEYAMLHAPKDPVELSVRRTSELTARLSLSSPVLVPEDDGDPEKLQFERIVAGLAKQLRSVLDRKLGRYSVDLPVFPEA
jgi:two-component system, sensor histidine kinase PdtaS